MVAAAQAEEKERQQVQDEIGEVEKHMLTILPTLEACSDRRKRQVSQSIITVLSVPCQQSTAISFKDRAYYTHEQLPVPLTGK